MKPRPPGIGRQVRHRQFWRHDLKVDAGLLNRPHQASCLKDQAAVAPSVPVYFRINFAFRLTLPARFRALRTSAAASPAALVPMMTYCMPLSYLKPGPPERKIAPSSRLA